MSIHFVTIRRQVMIKKLKYLKHSTFLLIICISMLGVLYYMDGFSTVQEKNKIKHENTNHVIQLEKGSPREQKLLHLLEEINNSETVMNNDGPLKNNSVVIVIQVRSQKCCSWLMTISDIILIGS